MFEDHLLKRKNGQIEEDILTKYAGDVILLTGVGVFRGHEGLRQSFQVLEEQFPDGE